jgi:putative copper export protein
VDCRCSCGSSNRKLSVNLKKKEGIMFIILIISKILLYACFSVLIGGLLIYTIPAERKPTILLSKKWLVSSTTLIAILSFFPVFSLASYIGKETGMGTGTAFWDVFLQMRVGHAALLMLLISGTLVCFLLASGIEKDGSGAILCLIFAAILVFVQSWASHTASIAFGGFIGHILHVLAVCVWSGILFIAGWFSKDQKNWLSFLRWFTPVSIGCMLTIVVAGLLLMQYTIPDYVSSWVLPYGEALLLKHLLLVPLLFVAFINGFLIKRSVENNSVFLPVSWVKAESVVIFFFFSATAVMTNSSPPHQVTDVIEQEGASPLYLLLGKPIPHFPAELSLHIMSVLLFDISLLFLGCMYLVYKKRVSPYFSIVMGAGFVSTVFLALLLAVS